MRNGISFMWVASLCFGCNRPSGSHTPHVDSTSDSVSYDTWETSDSNTEITAESDSGIDSGTGRPDCTVFVAPDAETVITRQGAVQGSVSEGVVSFKGIPYAAPPSGAFRFRPPQPPECLDSTLDASNFGPVCPQLEGGDGNFVGDEDCLTLNVWTPAALPVADSFWPVLFFIHGGGNGLGSASESTLGTDIYDGAALAEGANSVVVTVEYRLGALGWLVDPLGAAAGEPSGNFGLLDQIAALEWVQDNIEGFGGDASRVLVFGESAGALNTCMLLVSPAAAGLFHAAIMESGGCPGYSVEQVLETSSTLIDAAGCDTEDDPMECLRGLSAESIVKAFPPVIDVCGISAQTFYQPNVDGLLIPDKPAVLLETGAYNHMPFIVGANSDETSRSVPPNLSEAEYTAVVTGMFGLLASRVLEMYPISDFDTPADAYVQLSTDTKFVCPSRSIASWTASAQTPPVYRYFFTQDSGAAATARFGAFHGLELLFVFGHLRIAGFGPTADQEELSKTMMNYWGTLAADGDLEAADAVSWDAYDANLDNTLVLEGGAVVMENEIRKTECDFWEDLTDLLSQ